jgi:hypothetical protein
MGRVLAAILLAAAAATAAPKTTRHASADETVSIALPADWKVGPGGGRAALSLRATVPGDGEVRIDVYRVDGPNLTARAQAFYEMGSAKKKWKCETVRYVARPLPHLFMERGDDVTVLTYTRRLCRGLNVAFFCSRKLYDRVGPALLAAGASVQTTLGRWPAPPALREGYKRREKDGVLFLTAPDVDDKAAGRVQRAVLDVQKWIEKRIGSIDRPKGEPAVVYIHAGRVDVKHLDPGATLSSHGNAADPPGRLLFASPFEEEGDNPHLDLVYEAWRLLFREAMGDGEPKWLYVGERALYRNRVLCGKRAPAVPPSFIDDFKGVSHPLHRLADVLDAPAATSGNSDFARREAERARWRDYRTHAAVYCMFFRVGPSKYRRAYKTFLEHVHATGDVKDARRHLHEFDPDDLQQEVADWAARKLTVVAR